MSLLCITTVLLYIAASVYQFATLERIGDNPVVQQRNFLLSLLAVLGHAVILYQTIGQQGHLQLGFYNALSLTSFLVIAMILFTALTKPVLNISVLVMPFAALVIVLAELFPSDFQFQSGNFGLEIHILTSLVAYSLFTIAALQALLVSYQDKQLHAKHVTFVLKALPPLQLMEDLLVRVMGVGFLILTLSLISGVLFLEDMFAQHLVHKTALSILAWLVFAILLYGRRRHGWRGQTLTSWTLSGFVSLLLAYFGSKFVLEMLLHRI